MLSISFRILEGKLVLMVWKGSQKSYFLVREDFCSFPRIIVKYEFLHSLWKSPFFCPFHPKYLIRVPRFEIFQICIVPFWKGGICILSDMLHFRNRFDRLKKAIMFCPFWQISSNISIIRILIVAYYQFSHFQTVCATEEEAPH